MDEGWTVMTATEARCLHSQIDDAAATAEGGDIGEIRGTLTEVLRCSGQHGCSQAVSCSDDAMAILRRFLGGDSGNG